MIDPIKADMYVLPHLFFCAARRNRRGNVS